jgi:chromosome segregation ATPase
VKWLNRIRGKEQIPSTVAFDDIESWLDAASNSLFRGLNANAERLYKEIRAMRERLKQNTARLQYAEPEENMPANITKIGLLSRDKMVKQLYSLTEKMFIPTQTDYKTVSAFYNVTAPSIAFAFGKSSKSIEYVQSLFPNEVKAVLTDLRQLRTLLNLLITPVKGKESHITNLNRVPEIVEAIKELKARIEQEKENACEQEEAFAALERRIETEGERLRAIEEEEEEWTQFKELEAELSSLEEDLNALDADVNQLFSPLNKALHLLKKQDETGRHTLTPEERRAVSSLLSSPLQALNEEINVFLLAIRNIIERDPSILKERKRDSALKWIDHLLKSELSVTKVKRERLQSRIEELNGKLSRMTILKDRKEIEDSIVSAEGQRSRLQEEIERTKRHVVSREAELTETEQLLLDTLESLAGKKIEVKFD